MMPALYGEPTQGFQPSTGELKMRLRAKDHGLQARPSPRSPQRCQSVTARQLHDLPFRRRKAGGDRFDPVMNDGQSDAVSRRGQRLGKIDISHFSVPLLRANPAAPPFLGVQLAFPNLYGSGMRVIRRDGAPSPDRYDQTLW
jgi:hypothetical protein